MESSIWTCLNRITFNISDDSQEERGKLLKDPYIVISNESIDKEGVAINLKDIERHETLEMKSGELMYCTFIREFPDFSIIEKRNNSIQLTLSTQINWIK